MHYQHPRPRRRTRTDLPAEPQTLQLLAAVGIEWCEPMTRGRAERLLRAHRL